MTEDIIKAIEVFNQGGIVIFPTDTAYGIGCRIDEPEAIDRLFRLRERSEKKATPVLVSSIAMAQKYLKPIDSEIEEKLMKKYWPGGLTIVLPCLSDKIPEKVRGGGDTLGVRMPNHSMLLEIINKVGVPILAPSANFSNQNTPYKYQDIDKSLIKLVDYVLEGDIGGFLHSTVVDCSIRPWKILRQGAVNIDI